MTQTLREDTPELEMSHVSAFVHEAFLVSSFLIHKEKASKVKAGLVPLLSCEIVR